MVAVVVPSPAMSLVFDATSRTICAPMFSKGSLSSISFATVTPSLVMVGPPNFFSRTTLRPFGPRVTLTASANWFTPRRIACREASEYTICFAIVLSSLARFLCRYRLCVEDSEDFVLTHDQVLFVIQLDVAAGILAEQDTVAHLDIERHNLAVFQALAFTYGYHFAFLRFFLRGVGDVQTTLHLFLLLEPFDHDAVIERTNLHGLTTSHFQVFWVNFDLRWLLCKIAEFLSIISTLPRRVTRSSRI